MENQSDSSQESRTSTSNQDNRIVNESGIVVGTGGVYTQNFPDQAVDIISKVLDFSGGALSKAASFVDESIMNSRAIDSALIQSNKDIKSQDQLGNAALLNQLIPIMIIGVVGVFAFMAFKKK